MKGLILFIMTFLFLSCIFNQDDDCRVKEVTHFTLLDQHNKIIKKKLSKWGFRKDGQPQYIDYFNSKEVIRRKMFFKYNKHGECILSYNLVNGIYTDSTKAGVDKNGNIIPLRGVTILSYFDSELENRSLNDCGFPIDMIRYSSIRKKKIVSKDQYEYIYW